MIIYVSFNRSGIVSWCSEGPEYNWYVNSNELICVLMKTLTVIIFLLFVLLFCFFHNKFFCQCMRCLNLHNYLYKLTIRLKCCLLLLFQYSGSYEVFKYSQGRTSCAFQNIKYRQVNSWNYYSYQHNITVSKNDNDIFGNFMDSVVAVGHLKECTWHLFN